MDHFQLEAAFQPMGDQPEAIRELVNGFQKGVRSQVLLGVTGSGKTFTAANVIAQLNRPALVLSHNKTLAAQLYSEFKGFFPHNRVEYFVSYYDYYQPEAYVPSTDTYIEKDLSINQEIEKLRLSTTSALLSGRTDVIVVCSVSCLYGIGNPEDFHENTLTVHLGEALNRDQFLRQLVTALYTRNELSLERGNFRVKGDTVDIFPAIESYDGLAYRIEFWVISLDKGKIFDKLCRCFHFSETTESRPWCRNSKHKWFPFKFKFRPINQLHGEFFCVFIDTIDTDIFWALFCIDDKNRPHFKIFIFSFFVNQINLFAQIINRLQWQNILIIRGIRTFITDGNFFYGSFFDFLLKIFVKFII